MSAQHPDQLRRSILAGAVSCIWLFDGSIFRLPSPAEARHISGAIEPNPNGECCRWAWLCELGNLDLSARHRIRPPGSLPEPAVWRLRYGSTRCASCFAAKEGADVIGTSVEAKAPPGGICIDVVELDDMRRAIRDDGRYPAVIAYRVSLPRL
jgi:hypothetical protein